MPGEMRIRNMHESDCDAVMRIFNHYAERSFAAYPDGPLPPRFFPLLRQGALSAIVLEDDAGVVGFGLMKPFLPFPAFRKTGMLTYFIAPEAVRRGLGIRLLWRFIEEARVLGLKTLVANMSSRNEASISFHQYHGFEKVGNLSRVGEKFGKPFDILWMQRTL